MSTTAIVVIVIIVVIVLFALSQPSKIEARKNYILGDIDALELGINQVLIASGKFKGETPEQTASVQSDVMLKIEAVEELILTAEDLLEDATTEAQIKDVEDYLVRARRTLREARAMVNAEEDDEKDWKVSDDED